MNKGVCVLLLAVGFASSGTLFAESPLDPAPSVKGKYPGVLMIHEWWGLNMDIKKLADALSAEGYVVLAADAYRGKVAMTAQDASKLVQNTLQDQIHADLDAALTFLRSRRTWTPTGLPPGVFVSVVRSRCIWEQEDRSFQRWSSSTVQARSQIPNNREA